MTGRYPPRRGAWLLAPVSFVLTAAVLFLLGVAGSAALDTLVPRIENVFSPDHAHSQPINPDGRQEGDGENNCDRIFGRSAQELCERDAAAVDGEDNPCDLTVGSAGDHCEGRDRTEPDPDFTTAFLFLGPAMLAIGVLLALRRPR